MIAIEKKQLCYFSTLRAEMIFLVDKDCFLSAGCYNQKKVALTDPKSYRSG